MLIIFIYFSMEQRFPHLAAVLSSCPLRSTFSLDLDPQSDSETWSSSPPGSPPPLFFLSPQMTPIPDYLKRKLSSFLRTLFLLGSVPQPNDYLYYWPLSYESLCLWPCLILFLKVWIKCIVPLNDISTHSLTVVLPHLRLFSHWTGVKDRQWSSGLAKLPENSQLTLYDSPQTKWNCHCSLIHSVNLHLWPCGICLSPQQNLKILFGHNKLASNQFFTSENSHFCLYVDEYFPSCMPAYHLFMKPE